MGMKEWREIDGFPNYMISNTGEIKSLLIIGMKIEAITL